MAEHGVLAGAGHPFDLAGLAGFQRRAAGSQDGAARPDIKVLHRMRGAIGDCPHQALALPG